MSLDIINYASSYFKYKTPTPIRGVYTHKALKRLKVELQANASYIDTDLGGNHGYLVMVLMDQEYASIPNTVPFVIPTYPNPLKIPANTMAIEAPQLKELHTELNVFGYNIRI